MLSEWRACQYRGESMKMPNLPPLSALLHNLLVIIKSEMLLVNTWSVNMKTTLVKDLILDEVADLVCITET